MEIDARGLLYSDNVIIVDNIESVVDNFPIEDLRFRTGRIFQETGGNYYLVSVYYNKIAGHPIETAYYEFKEYLDGLNYGFTEEDEKKMEELKEEYHYLIKTVFLIEKIPFKIMSYIFHMKDFLSNINTTGWIL